MSGSSMTGALPPQFLLHERYEILDRVGRGGMGAVYRACDHGDHDRQVAVKEMSRARIGQDDLRRYQQEAQMLRSLYHPNLPRFFDSFSEDGRSYLVMEFIEGETLFSLLQKRASQGLSLAEVVRYGLQLCTALAYLHHQPDPIVFRDLKPTNVMITPQGHLYLIDFGIARFFKPGNTQDTEYFFSRGFAAPEQYGSGQTSPHSDLYSLGATLYYCVTGINPANNRRPFVFTPVQQVNSQVPSILCQLIEQLLDVQEERRPSDIDQVYQVLLTLDRQASAQTGRVTDSFFSDQTIAAPPYGKRTRPLNARELAQNSRWHMLLLAFAGLFVVIWTHLQQSGLFPWMRKQLDRVTRFLADEVFSAPFSFSRNIWTRKFIFRFVLLSASLLVGLLFLSGFLHIFTYLLAFFLCLLCLALGCEARIHKWVLSSFAGSLLVVVLVLSGLAMVSLISIPSFLTLLSGMTLNQVLTPIILGLALFVLFWPTSGPAWADHVLLTLVLLAYTLLFACFGATALTVLAIPSQSQAEDVAHILVFILLGMSLISLLRLKSPFERLEQMLTLGVAVAGLILQLAQGLPEIQHSPLSLLSLFAPSAGPGALMDLNVLLACVPVLFALIWIFLLPPRPALRRLPLLLLVLPCILLLDYLVPLISSPFQSLRDVGAYLLDINRLIAYGLPLLALFMFRRLNRPFEHVDHIILFMLSLIQTTLLVVLSTAQSSYLPPLAPVFPLSASIALYLPVFNQVVAVVMYLFQIVLFCVCCFQACLPLCQQFSRGKTWATHLQSLFQPLLSRCERILLFGSTLIVFLLIFTYGNNVQFFLLPLVVSDTTTFTVGQLIACGLGLWFFVALLRLARPFSTFDHWLLLVNAVACLPLFFTGGSDPTFPLLPAVYPFLTGPLLSVPSWCAVLIICLLVLTLCLWTRYEVVREDRFLCWVMCGLAFLCILLQWISSFFLLLALLFIIQQFYLLLRIEHLRSLPHA